MRNQQHNATILKALRRDQKSQTSRLARNRHYAETQQSDEGRIKWEGHAKHAEQRLEEIAEAIEYMESLPIYLGCTSNKGGGEQ